MRIFKIFILLTIFLLFTDSVYACEDWFKNLNIKDFKSCESKCRTSPTDMSNYLCTGKCDVLCKGLKKKEVTSNDNIYGLTDDEIKFCKENTLHCLEAYRLTWSAEKLCLSVYPRSSMNDESDACRHYIWAMLLARDLGLADAEVILNAHESGADEPEEDRAMDLANNRLSNIDFLKLKDKKMSDQTIVDKFKENLKNKKLVIIKPKYSKSGGLP